MNARFSFHDFRDALCWFRPKCKRRCLLHFGYCPSKRRSSLGSTMSRANKVMTDARRELFRELLKASLSASGALRGICAHLAIKDAA